MAMQPRLGVSWPAGQMVSPPPACLPCPAALSTDQCPSQCRAELDGALEAASYDVTQEGHVMSLPSYPSLLALHRVSWAIAPGQSLRHPHCPTPLSPSRPGDGDLVFREAQGPGPAAGAWGCLTCRCPPTDTSQDPLPRPGGCWRTRAGSSKWWSWAPLCGAWLTYSRTGGTLTPQPLAPSSCGEPDAADSWRAGLPGAQSCPRRGWVHFNNFISPARTLRRLVLLSCLPRPRALCSARSC